MNLSIIIVNWNTADILKDCIRSIQKHPPNKKHEIIVVDNGSTDNSPEYLEKISKKPNIKVILNDQNLGFSKANNIGLKKSKAKHILLLNSDTLVTKNALNILIKSAENIPSAAIIAPKLLNKDGSTQPSVFREPTILRNIKQYWLKQKHILDKYAPNSKDAVEVEAVVGAAMLLTPDAIKKVGLLNENYFMYFEDLDYCRKARKAGLRVIYEPKSTIYHLHGVSGKSVVAKKDQWKRLIPGSKTYHGLLKHYIIFFIQWTSQKSAKLFSNK